MTTEIVKNWFGGRFRSLHPLLQQLHTLGGRLAGDVEISYGTGLAGVIGARVARKMNLPNAGIHQLVIDIHHDETALHWGRSFDDQTIVYSVFKPVGTIDKGYWVEQTGVMTFKLAVDIKNDGWYWRCLEIKYRGIPMPSWLMPKTNAYKTVEEGKYRFYVGLSMPVIGTLFSYQGLLDEMSGI